MTTSVHYPCLLHTPSCLLIHLPVAKHRQGMAFLQMDDTLNIDNKWFSEKEEQCSKEFLSNKNVIFTSINRPQFDGGVIALYGLIFRLQQPQHITKLKSSLKTNVNRSSFASQCELETYIASITSPDLIFGFAVCLNIENWLCRYHKETQWLRRDFQEGHRPGLRFLPLNGESVRIMVTANARLASNIDMKSQLSFVIRLVDKHSQANIFQHSSFKTKHAICSSSGVYVFAHLHSVDFV